MNTSDRQHLDKIRTRFTSTAESFARFTCSGRTNEISQLLRMLTAHLPQPETVRAIDIACGPGTFSLPVAARVAHVVGADFTPVMLAKGRQAAELEGLGNIDFVCADGYSLPFADDTFDVALCCYALHHLTDPQAVIREMARVVRPEGRVAIADLILPAGADAAAHNQIASIRDPSHASTLHAREIDAWFADAEMRVLESAQQDRQRKLADWMSVAGRTCDSAEYAEARRLLLHSLSLSSDTSGFRPQLDPETGELNITQMTIFVVAEKSTASDYD